MAGSPTDATSADNETTLEVDFDYVGELLDLYRTTIESIQGTPKYRRAPLLTEARKTVYAIAQALGIPTLAQVRKDEQAAVVARAAAAADEKARRQVTAGLVDFEKAVQERRNAQRA